MSDKVVVNVTGNYVILNDLIQEPGKPDYYEPMPIKLDIENDFTIDETNIDGELCMASKRMVYYGNLSAELEAQATRSKDRLDQYYSELAIKTRAAHAGGKLTEGGLKEIILTDPQYISMQDKCTTDYMYQKKVENFFKSQQKRVDCILALGYKQRAEIQKGMM